MTPHVALTTVLHAVRARKPEAQIARETQIALHQLRKFRTGARVPSVDQWTAIVRSVYEVSPEGALALAAAALPTDLFAVTPVAGAGESLQREVLEASAAVGEVSAALAEAQADGTLSPAEIDGIEQRAETLLQGARELQAACQRARDGEGAEGR